MLRPYIIGVLSQKGGVGKTTVSVNLAIALKLQNKRVLIIDADTDNPTVGLHLGMEGTNVGFEDLVTKDAKLASVVSIHGSSGLHCVLGTLRTRPFMITSRHVEALFKQVENCNYDFVVVDTAPGLQKEEDSMPFDDALIVATPDLPALTSALRLGEELKSLREKYSLALNRVTGKSYELRTGEIEDAWGGKVAAALPEDLLVSESLAARIPASLSSGSSPFTSSVKRLASMFVSRAERASKRGPQFNNWKRALAASKEKGEKRQGKMSQAAIRKEEETRLVRVAETLEKESGRTGRAPAGGRKTAKGLMRGRGKKARTRRKTKRRR